MKWFLIVCFCLVVLPACPGEPPNLVDIAYRAGKAKPTLDFYAPAGKGFPTVVHVYGSGWRSGSGKSSAPVAEALRRHGIGCVLVSPRLAPAHSIRDQGGRCGRGICLDQSTCGRIRR